MIEEMLDCRALLKLFGDRPPGLLRAEKFIDLGATNAHYRWWVGS